MIGWFSPMRSNKQAIPIIKGSIGINENLLGSSSHIFGIKGCCFIPPLRGCFDGVRNVVCCCGKARGMQDNERINILADLRFYQQAAWICVLDSKDRFAEYNGFPLRVCCYRQSFVDPQFAPIEWGPLALGT